MAFRESDGEFLWQHTHAKLESGRANDWPFQGVASSPLVEGNRLYYVSNRGVVWCLDTNGFRDSKNDGPITDEKLTSPTDPDVIWSFDMIEEVGSYPHNLANSSPVDLRRSDLRQHVERPGREPRARAVAEGAVDHRAQQDTPASWCGRTTRSATRSCTASGRRRPSARIGGVDQVVSAQGDGWVRGYEAATGKKLWEFDTNPKDSVWPRTRNEIIATPVIYSNRVYIANGQDPEHGEGVGHFYAIDATKRGDITKTGRIFHFDKIRRSISTAAIADGLIYLPDFSGFFHCIDAKTGQEYWVHDLTSAIWGSAMVIDGKVYIGNEDGDVVDPAGGQGEEGARDDEHGQRGVRDGRAREQHAVHHEPQSVVRDWDEVVTHAWPRSSNLVIGRRWSMRGVDLSVGSSAVVSAQAPPIADAWPQFRGNPRLTGVAASTPPATLKVLWTYEAGDSIDSSAAIARRHGVRRVPQRRADRRWSSPRERSSGSTRRRAGSRSRRPAVTGGCRLRRRLGRRRARRRRA